MSTYPTEPTGNDIIDLTNVFATNNINKVLMTSAEILEGYNNDGELATPLTSMPDGNKYNYYWYQMHNTVKWLVEYVNALFTNKVETDGDTMSGALDMGSNKITSTYVPTADKDITNKLYVDTAVSGGMWLGEIKTLSYTTIPTLPAGMEVVEADGRELSRTTYADYFAMVGITYGAGDLSTTFNIPDLRGVTQRGWDNGRGLDTDRLFGSYQEDTLQNITGTMNDITTGNTVSFSGAFSGTRIGANDQNIGAYHRYNINFDASNVARTSNETRMKNIALYNVVRIK